MDKGPINGRMDVNTKDNTITIKNMDSEHTLGFLYLYLIKLYRADGRKYEGNWLDGQ